MVPSISAWTLGLRWRVVAPGEEDHTGSRGLCCLSFYLSLMLSGFLRQTPEDVKRRAEDRNHRFVLQLRAGQLEADQGGPLRVQGNPLPAAPLVTIAQRRVGGKLSLLRLLLKPLAGLLGEVVDVVLGCQHLDAVDELLVGRDCRLSTEPSLTKMRVTSSSSIVT
jgi:hypothetical protein